MSIDPSLEFIEFIPMNENQLHQYEPLLDPMQSYKLRRKCFLRLIAFGNVGSYLLVEEN